jgi:hypothetical protein
MPGQQCLPNITPVLDAGDLHCMGLEWHETGCVPFSVLSLVTEATKLNYAKTWTCPAISDDMSVIMAREYDVPNLADYLHRFTSLVCVPFSTRG